MMCLRLSLTFLRAYPVMSRTTAGKAISTEGERKVAAAEYFEELFGARLAEMRAESEEKRTKAARFAHMFRFITPSYYIPGDQEWGAY